MSRIINYLNLSSGHERGEDSLQETLEEEIGSCKLSQSFYSSLQSVQSNCSSGLFLNFIREYSGNNFGLPYGVMEEDLHFINLQCDISRINE